MKLVASRVATSAASLRAMNAPNDTGQAAPMSRAQG